MFFLFHLAILLCKWAVPCVSNMAIYTLISLLLLVHQTYALVISSPEQLALWPTAEQVSQKKDDIPFRENSFPKKIAIIGSGITGASAASRLYEGFRVLAPADQQPTITVFERNPIIGGRITQAYVYDSMRLPVDTCAATFDSGDLCIAQSVMLTGLTLQQQSLARPRAGVGIWNGVNMVATEDEFRDAQTWSEFRQDKWSKRYGRSPSAFAPEVAQIRASLSLVLSRATPSLPFVLLPGNQNVSDEVETGGLTGYVRTFARKALPELFDNVEGQRFGDEIVNAGARERYFANGDELNVLEFILGFEDQRPSFVGEGNLRLVERLLKLATADVRLGTEVQKIETVDENDIRLTLVPTDGGVPTTEQFDTVILASSYSLSNITFEPPIQNSTDLEQNYLDSFVIHFTSTSRLNQTFFKRTETMPQNVFTTVGSNDTSSPPFLSLTLLRRQTPPDDLSRPVENLYKLVSREDVAFTDIEQYLEAPANITWINVQPLPRSVPVQVGKNGQGCKPVLEHVEIAPGLFYAGAGEQVIASADFGCRSGVNAADLVLFAARS